MPCGEKIHIVREKWERKTRREQEEAERQRKEVERGIPVEGWPMPAKLPAPAEAENG